MEVKFNTADIRTLEPSGSGNSYGYLLTHSHNSVETKIPVEVTASSQSAKSGVRRTMIRVAMRLPSTHVFVGDLAGVAAASGVTEELTAHVVVTSGKTFSQLHAIDTSIGSPAEKCLSEVVSVLATMMLGPNTQQQSLNTAKATGDAFVRALDGMLPLKDITYGVLPN